MKGWTVTTILVPVAMLILGLLLASYWYRPQLSISVAKALTGSHRVIRNDRVYEFRGVHDLQKNCMAWLVEYSAPNDGTLPPPMKAIAPRIVYGIYLENPGRSELTDIRLTFQGGEFEIAASPQFSLTQSKQIDPSGQPLHTIIVGSIPPGGGGVVTGTLSAHGGRFTVEPTGKADFEIEFSADQINRTLSAHSHVRFAGARQVSDTPITVMSVDELFTRQQAVFGLDALPLPIDPSEISATAEDFKLRGPFMVCASSSPDAYAAYSGTATRRPPVSTSSTR